MQRTMALCLSIVALTSCSGPAVPELGIEDYNAPNERERDLFKMLVGNWQDMRTEGDPSFHEQWVEDPEGHLTGLGVVLSGKDTVWIEHLRILRTDSGTWYEATIPTQNEGDPVPFEMTNAKDSLVFSNPEHDFPQFITYVPTSDGGWSVRVSGMRQGTHHAEHFRFRRQGTPKAPAS